MTDDATDERQVLRSIWAADGQRLDVDEEVSPTKACRNMKDVTFDALAEPGCDVQSAWKARLARAGQLSASGGSIRDLVLGPATDDDR